MVFGLSKLLDHNDPFEFESDNKTAEEEIDLQLCMQEKLARIIGNEFQNKFQIEKNERCNEYCEKNSYFRSRRQSWT
jgi:hypothetical protein